MSRHRWAFCLK
jgi:CheY-like chemotaxis protein